MTLEELHEKLVEIISNLTSSGFVNVDPETMEKLYKYAVAAGEMGLKEGKRLIENLTETMKAIQEGRSNTGSGILRLTALEFYLKRYPIDEPVEDL